MSDCRDCIHYRLPHRISEALAQDCGVVSTPVLEASAHMREEEGKLLVSELSEKKDLMLRDCPDWPQRPRMTDYCAVHESQNLFHICDLKNAGGKCRQFSPGRPPARKCSTCVHRAPPFGRERDLKITEFYMRAGATMPMFQAANVQRQAEHETACSKAVANQIKLAYVSNGPFEQRPEYLSVCKAFSTPGETYSICVLQNSSNTCAHWKGASSSGSSSSYTHQLTNDQLDWKEIGGVELLLQGTTLKLRFPDAEFGPPKHVAYDVRNLPDNGAAQLALPGGTRFPLLVRFVNGVAHIRSGITSGGLAYPLAMPVDEAPEQFQARPEKCYRHPRKEYSLRVSGSSLLVYGHLGLATPFDLSQMPPNTWMTPVSAGIGYPLRYRLDWADFLCKAYVPWVQWL